MGTAALRAIAIVIGSSALVSRVARAETRAQEAAAAGAGTQRTHWALSAYARWFPGIADAKGDVAEGGTGQGGMGFGLRLERELHPWWSVSVGMSSSAWGYDAPEGQPGAPLASGSFLDAAVGLELHPFRLQLPGSELRPYLLVAGGPTLAGLAESGVPLPDATTLGDLIAPVQGPRFDAGYNAGVWLGLSWRPLPRLSVLAEGGLDWHYAAHARRELSAAALAGTEPLEPSVLERLWVGQAVVQLGAAWHF